jgi:DNA mismatch repair protein MutS
VEVARLAGVPTAVVARARALLADLERGGGVGHGPIQSSGAPAGQLTLFASADEQLRREVAGLDPERMTPMEAIAVLAGLVARARG